MSERTALQPYTTISHSTAHTLLCGKNLAKTLKHGDIVALNGELGCGKTQFVKGIAQNFNIDANSIISPTYTFINTYSNHNGIKLYHSDLYRIKDIHELQDINWYEYITDDAIHCIEWYHVAKDYLPPSTLLVSIEYLSYTQRKIAIKKMF